MLKNLTPHEVKIFKLNGTVPDLDVVIEAGEEVARVSCEYVKVDKKVEGVDMYRTVFGEVTGLPDYKEGVFNDDLNTNIISFNEDLNGAIQYANKHNSKINSYRRAFPVKCLKDKINLITFFKEGPFIDYVRNDEFDDINVANHIANKGSFPLVYVIA